MRYNASATLPHKIARYVHCLQCLRELPMGQSPAEWAQLEVGFTNHGTLQVWCMRHNFNVIDILLAEGDAKLPPCGVPLR